MARTPTTKTKRTPARKPTRTRTTAKRAAAPKKPSAAVATTAKRGRPFGGRNTKVAATPAARKTAVATAPKMNKAELEAHVAKLEKALGRAKKTIADLRSDAKAKMPLAATAAPPAPKVRRPRVATTATPVPDIAEVDEVAAQTKRGRKARIASEQSLAEAEDVAPVSND